MHGCIHDGYDFDRDDFADGEVSVIDKGRARWRDSVWGQEGGVERVYMCLCLSLSSFVCQEERWSEDVRVGLCLSVDQGGVIIHTSHAPKDPGLASLSLSHRRLPFTTPC